MAGFKIIVQKTDSVGQFWVNDYLVEAPDRATAHDAGVEIIAGAEKSLHVSFITIDKVRTSTLAAGDTNFQTTALGLAGELGSSGNALALFNCVRADLNASLGKPGRKFYRTGMGGGNMGGGYKWDSTPIAAIQAVLDDMRTALVEAGVIWILPGSRTVDVVEVFDKVSMRQLRRGSKRPTEPII